MIPIPCNMATKDGRSKPFKNNFPRSVITLGILTAISVRRTRSAVLALQADRGLPTTGIVDAATRGALADNISRPIAEDRKTASLDDLRDAGSTTIASADTISTVGKTKVAIGTAALGVGTLSDQTDTALNQAQNVADKIAQAHSIWATVSDYLSPVFANPGVALAGILFIALGALSWLAANRIKQSRLQSHRSGKDMGR